MRYTGLSPCGVLVSSKLSRTSVLECLLQLPGAAEMALILGEPSDLPLWMQNPAREAAAPGATAPLDGASRILQRNRWVLKASVKHHDARTRLRLKLKPWRVAVFDLATEPSVKVVAPVQTLREILRQHKALEVRTCNPQAVHALAAPLVPESPK